VGDDGPGIPADKQSDVFTPFNRLGMEAKGIEGTGIGLTISKQLVGLMGGTIGFDSVERVGSTFWFELPGVDGPAPVLVSELKEERVVEPVVQELSGPTRYKIL
jgi:signal transduction histidine kinase